jgi:DNA polymerase
MPSHALTRLYASVATCANRCAGVQNEPEAGIMGRSFYCPYGPGGISLLMVSKNPGISDPRENALYKSLDGAGRVREHESFVRDRFLGTNTIIKSRYHANILAWVSVILGVKPDHDSVFSKAAMTALVKCHSSGAKTDALPDPTKKTCVDKYLYAEISAIKPRYLLALGGEAYDYLMLPHVRARHQLPVGKLYHPSWSNMRGGSSRYIAEKLPKIREDYLRAIAAQ